MKLWADVGDWLVIGTWLACDRVKADICIHIFRSDFTDTCQFKSHGHNDLIFDYRDGEPFTEEMFTQLDGLVAKIRQMPRIPKVLVHCHAGITRSPTVAVYLYSRVLTCGIFEAAKQISLAIWRDRQDVPNLTQKAMKCMANRGTL